MPIGPDSPNFMVIDMFAVIYFASITAMIIMDVQLTLIEYLLLTLVALWTGIRFYIIISDWLKSRNYTEKRLNE